MDPSPWPLCNILYVVILSGHRSISTNNLMKLTVRLEGVPSTT